MVYERRVNRLSSIFAFVLMLASGLALGVWLTTRVLDGGATPGALRYGPWILWPKAGAPDADPYSLAVFARRGDVPMSPAEGLAFFSSRDSAGDVLRGSCTYEIQGQLPQARAWTLTIYKPDGRLLVGQNALLIGFTRRLKAALQAPVVCMLQGEDTFLDALPEAQRLVTWQALAERAAEADLFIAPTHYFGKRMGERLGLPAGRVRVVHNGISLDGFQMRSAERGVRNESTPVLGYFARMCREKGLDTLIEAFIVLKQRDRVKNLKLRIGGGCGPSDKVFVDSLRERLKATGFLGDVEFHPNLDRAGKQAFLRSLSVFSVPALYGEAFGLYIIEALASSVPVVQPRHAAFPE